jgi:hypothetical protein
VCDGPATVALPPAVAGARVELPLYHDRHTYQPDEILPPRPRALILEERVALLERQAAA